MSEVAKCKGSASYFPSIKKKYGKPIVYWMTVIKNVSALKDSLHKSAPCAADALKIESC